jgi:hypothetical protein
LTMMGASVLASVLGSGLGLGLASVLV